MTELNAEPHRVFDLETERFLVQQVRQALAIALSSLDQAKGLLGVQASLAEAAATPALGAVERELDRCAFVLERLRRFVQRRAVPGRLHTSAVDVRSLVEGAVLATAPGRHKHLRVRLGAVGDGMIRGDEVLLFEAFAGLLSSAADATGDRPAQIDVECTTTGTEVVVIVRDSGPGMTERELKRAVGERAASNSFGARGATLVFVRDVAWVHGGRMDVVTEPDRGTSVTVTIPVAESKHAQG